MEILFGICLVKSRYGEDDAFGRRLGGFLARLGCNIFELDLSGEGAGEDFSHAGFSPHVIHGFHLAKAGFICERIASRARVPFIITCTGTDVFIDLQTPGLNDRIRHVLGSADKVVVPFPGMLPYLREVVPEDHWLTVIPKGIVPPEPRVVPDFAGRGIADGDRVVLLPGAVLPVKNTMFAIQTVESLVARVPRLKLVIMGTLLDREFGQDFHQAIAGHPWIIHLPDPLPEETAHWYRRAEVVINVSHAEGGCHNLLEAMALGATVLASDIPGNRAFILDENDMAGQGTGFLYSTSPAPTGFRRLHEREDFLGKLEYLMGNPEVRARTGIRASSWVKENLNPELEAFLYLELYRKLTQK